MTKTTAEELARVMWIAEGYSPEYWDTPPSRRWSAHMDEKRPIYNKKAQAILASPVIAKIERDAEMGVVEWLRDDADLTEIAAAKIVKNTTGNARQNAAEWAMLVRLKRGLATAIEAGEHKEKVGE